jgi:hypothetical protein
MASVEDAPVSTFEDRIKRWQAGLDFTKSILIFLLVLFFVLSFFLYPKALWSTLERAGLRVTSLELFGATLTKTQEAAVDLDAALKEALFNNQMLQKELESTQASLAKATDCLSDVDTLRNCTRNTELVERLKLDQAAVAQSRQLATSSAAAASGALRSNAAVLQDSYASVAAAGAGQAGWGIVFGGDVSVREAEAEIAKAKDVEDLAIYHRQRSYRSVAVFDTRAEAERWLPRLRGINSGAYVVVLDRWCQSPQRERRDRYTLVECGG